jgi:hypothetical protein
MKKGSNSMNADTMKLFKQACKVMTEAQKDQIKGFRQWEKAQKEAWVLTKIYDLLKTSKRKMAVTDVVVSFKKDYQNIASDCLRDLVRRQVVYVDGKWNCSLNKEAL